MKPVVFLRIASVLTLIHAVLHTIGGVFSKPVPGAGAVAFAAMQTNQFPLLGHMRSYADFYRGMGLAVTIFLIFEAIVFWQLGSLAATAGTRLRPILWAFLRAYIGLAVNSYEYFFIAPVVVEILIAACLGCAIFALKPATDSLAEPIGSAAD